jgi:hypothetical protein
MRRRFIRPNCVEGTVAAGTVFGEVRCGVLEGVVHDLCAGGGGGVPGIVGVVGGLAWLPSVRVMVEPSASVVLRTLISGSEFVVLPCYCVPFLECIFRFKDTITTMATAIGSTQNWLIWGKSRARRAPKSAAMMMRIASIISTFVQDNCFISLSSSLACFQQQRGCPSRKAVVPCLRAGCGSGAPGIVGVVGGFGLCIVGAEVNGRCVR